MRETVQVTYHRLVQLRPDPAIGEKGGLKLVLRTVPAVQEQREFVLDVPDFMAKEVTFGIRHFVTRRVRLGSVIDDLLPVTGVMFRGIIIWRSMIDDELQADAYTLSLEGEEATFSISNLISAVLFAFLKERPIQIEKKLIEEQPIIPRNPNEHNEMSFMDRYSDYSAHVIERHIRKHLGTQLFRPGELEETFVVLGVSKLHELLDLALLEESFEWAQIITEFLKKYHPSSFEDELPADEEDTEGSGFPSNSTDKDDEK